MSLHEYTLNVIEAMVPGLLDVDERYVEDAPYTNGKEKVLRFAAALRATEAVMPCVLRDFKDNRVEVLRAFADCATATASELEHKQQKEHLLCQQPS